MCLAQTRPGPSHQQWSSKVIRGWMNAKEVEEMTFIDGPWLPVEIPKYRLTKWLAEDEYSSMIIIQSTQKFLKEGKLKTMTRPSVLPDWNPAEHQQLKEMSLKNGTASHQKSVWHRYSSCQNGSNLLLKVAALVSCILNRIGLFLISHENKHLTIQLKSKQLVQVHHFE